MNWPDYLNCYVLPVWNLNHRFLANFLHFKIILVNFNSEFEPAILCLRSCGFSNLIARPPRHGIGSIINHEKKNITIFFSGRYCLTFRARYILLPSSRAEPDKANPILIFSLRVSFSVCSLYFWLKCTKKQNLQS